MNQLLEDYLAINPAVKSPHSIRLLSAAVTQFSRFLQRPARIEDLTDRNLVSFMRARRLAGKSEATVEREAAKLMTLWRYAASRGLVLPHTIRLVKAPVAPPVAFLRHEVRALFKAARKYHATIGGVRGSVLMLALLGCCWDTAERVGALSDVRWGDVDISNRWITIRSRKNGGRTLTRRLSRSTCRSLRALAAGGGGPDDKIFGRVHRGTLYHHLGKLLISAGLPSDRRHKFHCLRRSHASYLHLAGGDARESLDHSSEEITRTRYYDPKIVQTASTIRLLFSPFSWWDRVLILFGF